MRRSQRVVAAWALPVKPVLLLVMLMANSPARAGASTPCPLSHRGEPVPEAKLRCTNWPPDAASSRCWYELLPQAASSQGGAGVPLLIDLHEDGGCAAERAQRSGFHAQAIANHGLAVAWPQAAGAWNAGWCCSRADDLGFVTQLVSDIVAQQSVPSSPHAQIDPRRIYVSGHGGGCAMAMALLAHRSSIFAAAACTSASLLTEPAASYTPRPIMLVRGMLDAVVPYAGRSIADAMGGARTRYGGAAAARRDNSGGASANGDTSAASPRPTGHYYLPNSALGIVQRL
jgi:poly(3-hydroxybutyrate) depolymerase